MIYKPHLPPLWRWWVFRIKLFQRDKNVCPIHPLYLCMKQIAANIFIKQPGARHDHTTIDKSKVLFFKTSDEKRGNHTVETWSKWFLITNNMCNTADSRAIELAIIMESSTSSTPDVMHMHFPQILMKKNSFWIT